MRKKLAIYIGEIAGAFQQTIVNVITNKANKIGYDVVVLCSYGTYNDDIMYAEGEKASINLADPSIFDGIIVSEDLFDNPGMGDELYEKLKQEATCPVVYLRTLREGFYSILLENAASIESVVRHFADDHGFNDIVYMSGKVGTLDSVERLKGYMNVMNEKGINVTDHMIFHGDYWRDKGAEALDWFMEGRDTYPQAVVCANDYMALSICEELRQRGVRVPEDVCVSGFDFVQEARAYEPTLTSLEVDFAGMSELAVDIINNVNNGIAEEYIQYMPAKLMLNKSCGCGEQFKISNAAQLIEDNYRHLTSVKNNMLLTMEYQDCFEMNEFMDIADKYRFIVKANRIMFCFNDITEQGSDTVENDSSFTNNMGLFRVFEGKDKTTVCNKVFPRKQLLPEEFWSEDGPNNYFFFTIHYKNIVYGYMVAEDMGDEWFDIYNQAYLLNLGNAIERGNAHRRMEMLEEIRALYQKDSLTGIYNRRGYDRLLRERFAKARDNDVNIGIASIDMDNLKVVNDNFGHSSGDTALKLIAMAIENALDEGEFCARVGGDEFAAVLNIADDNRINRFKSSVYRELRDRSAIIADYKVEASIGIFETAEDKSATLVECMQMADMRMYNEKSAKKIPR